MTDTYNPNDVKCLHEAVEAFCTKHGIVDVIEREEIAANALAICNDNLLRDGEMLKALESRLHRSSCHAVESSACSLVEGNNLRGSSL